MKLPIYLKVTKEGLLLEVVVTPKAKRSAFVGLHGGYPRIALAAPPVDGRANEALVEFLAEALGVPQRSVRLARGATARRKAVLIQGVLAEALVQHIDSLTVKL